MQGELTSWSISLPAFFLFSAVLSVTIAPAVRQFWQEMELGCVEEGMEQPSRNRIILPLQLGRHERLSRSRLNLAC